MPPAPRPRGGWRRGWGGRSRAAAGRLYRQTRRRLPPVWSVCPVCLPSTRASVRRRRPPLPRPLPRPAPAGAGKRVSPPLCPPPLQPAGSPTTPPPPPPRPSPCGRPPARRGPCRPSPPPHPPRRGARGGARRRRRRLCADAVGDAPRLGVCAAAAARGTPRRRVARRRRDRRRAARRQRRGRVPPPRPPLRGRGGGGGGGGGGGLAPPPRSGPAAAAAGALAAVARLASRLRSWGDPEAAVAAAARRVDAALQVGTVGVDRGAAAVPASPADVDGGVVKASAAGGGGDGAVPPGPYAAYRELFVTEPLPPLADAPVDDGTWARLRVAGVHPYALRAAGGEDVRAAAAAAGGGGAVSPTPTCGRWRAAPPTALRRPWTTTASGQGVFGAAAGGGGRPPAAGGHPRRAADGGGAPPSTGRRGDGGGGARRGARAAAPPPSVVTPADGASWAVAKAALTAADGTDHQLTWHVGRTHVLLNALAYTAHRSLAASHPVLRLVAPHFAGTLSIANLAEAVLLPAEGAVDALLPGPVGAMHAAAVDALRGWSLWAAAVPDELAARGVTDGRLAYPYREDAGRVWAALHAFVEVVVAACPRGGGGGGGGGTGRRRRRRRTARRARHCDAGGADAPPDGHCLYGVGAARGAQLSPKAPRLVHAGGAAGARRPRPAAGGCRRHPPPSGAAPGAAAAAVAAALPPPLTAARQLFVFNLLGSVVVSRLGDYPWVPWRGGWFRHGGVAAAAGRLRSRLDEIDADVRAREAGEALPYLFLAPSNIPMSADI
ncbi:hypothetical protein BU14_0348s0008 [Porphyra umbilicalis]|uniref:Lipoxygenase domain-containing protein n=1 Tax=Porphyra umbilicalis TaxID=2786 RepID=A0A1X6NXT4_PORUM|nr:hypothetical protein BU14_0348s0008 [Porphyra umbilicalis]|eukprot:OSX73431.1 hypothetical protein BU14_0348s0008 [Porphyra umbilicalis]